MTNSELMRAMSDAGAPFEAILIAIAALDAKDAEIRSRDDATALRKATDAARKRDERASKDNPRTVPGDVQDPPYDTKTSTPQLVSEAKASSTKPRRAKPSYFSVCPDGVDPQHWSDFVGNRTRKRFPDSPTAYAAQMKALATISDGEWPPGRLVEHAAAKGWGSINDPRKPLNGNGNDNGNRQPNPNGIGRTTAAAISVIDRLNRGSAERSEVPRISHAG